MHFSQIFRDHPVNPDEPWVVPESYRQALWALAGYENPQLPEPTCEGARCDVCGTSEFDSDHYLEIITIVFRFTRPHIQHFRCFDCFQKHGSEEVEHD